MKILTTKVLVRNNVIYSLNVYGFDLPSRKKDFKNTHAHHILSYRQGEKMIKNAIELEKRSEIRSIEKI